MIDLCLTFTVPIIFQGEQLCLCMSRSVLYLENGERKKRAYSVLRLEYVVVML